MTDRVGVIYGPFDLPDRNNRGFRNNVVITRTAGGLVVFDPGGSAWAGEMVVRVCAQSYPGEPIVAVFNSHAHGDHWLGNEGVRRHYPGVPIHAHPRMLEKAAGNDGHAWLATINRVTDGAADGRNLTPPDQAVGDGDELTIGDVQFRILHTGSAHTDNDLMIEIVGEDVLFMGDVVRNGMLGIMEGDSDFAGNIEAIDQIVARGFRHYIPGHGRAGGAETALVYRDYLHGVRSTVARLYEEGAEDFEMKPQVEMAVDRFRDWVGFDLRLGAHVSRVYLEVEAAAF
ncbi:MAG: MBL fold metallo-hydrolase [Chromatiales bacterium]|nr:MBL fold metallo-hydrolase [Chromatiales bacterium]